MRALRGTDGGEANDAGASGGAPGKRSRSERLPIQRKAAGAPVIQRKVGWSQGTANQAETPVGAMRRVPIEGLTTVGGVTGGRAICIVPSGLDVTQAIEVMIHLHGHNNGYADARDSSAKDRLEQQLEASGRGQMLGLLPQGTPSSDFRPTGGSDKGFDADAFIREAVTRLVSEGTLTAMPPMPPANVVLTAHSGGGQAAGMMLESQAPTNLGEVALFDAINGAGDELPRIETWLVNELERERVVLRNLATDQARLAWLTTSFRFRAYHTAGGSYDSFHKAKDKDPDAGKPLPATMPANVGFIPLEAFFQRYFANVPELAPPVVTAWAENFKVIHTTINGGDHDSLVGKSNGIGTELAALAPLSSLQQKAGSDAHPMTGGHHELDPMLESGRQLGTSLADALGF